MQIIILTAVLLAVIVFYVALSIYLRLRNQSNAALELAVKEFHRSAESLLRTPEDLPSDVLVALRSMNKIAFLGGSDRMLYRFIKGDLAGKHEMADGSPLLIRVQDMRPELKGLFINAVSAWISIMSNRSVYVGTQIQFELQEAQLKSGSVTRPGVSEAEALKVLPKMNHCAAA